MSVCAELCQVLSILDLLRQLLYHSNLHCCGTETERKENHLPTLSCRGFIKRLVCYCFRPKVRPNAIEPGAQAQEDKPYRLHQPERCRGAGRNVLILFPKIIMFLCIRNLLTAEVLRRYASYHSGPCPLLLLANLLGLNKVSFSSSSHLLHELLFTR